MLFVAESSKDLLIDRKNTIQDVLNKSLQHMKSLMESLNMDLELTCQPRQLWFAQNIFSHHLL
jgi:hypothetical protein